MAKGISLAEINSVIVSSRVRIARNLEGVAFKTKRTDAFDSLATTIEKSDSAFLSKTKIRDLTAEMRRALFEQHLISRELLDNKTNGYIVCKKDYHVCVMLGEEDHARIQAIEVGFNLDSAFDEAIKVARAIEASHEVAYRSDFGYLTSCPTNLGTAIRASVMVFLPALTITRRLGAVIDRFIGEHITVRGTYGEGSESGGHMYQISNQACLGRSESEIIESVKQVTLEIVSAELEAERRLFSANPDEVIDQVYRAYGLLTNAFMISSEEAVEHLAFLKLGCCLDIIRFKNNRILDDLFFIIRPATLTAQDTRAQNIAERDKIRAARVKDILLTSRIK